MSKLVEQVFDEILARDGILDPERIHDEVADAEHPLHGRYEWDDAVAGRKHRISQIRTDIRMVSVKFVTSNDEDGQVPKYINTFRTGRTDQEKGYLLAEPILSDPLQAQRTLRAARRELLSHQRRYGHLEEYTQLLQQAAAGTLTA